MNSVVLIGRLTKDPELRYIPESQTAVATFTLAVDRPFAKEKTADFIRIITFGRQAENCDRFLEKGRLTAVQGRIQTGSYKDKNGATVYTTDVVADRVEFLEWGEKAEALMRNGGRSGGSDYRFSGSYGDYEKPKYDPEDPYSGFQALDDDDDIPF